MSERSFQRRGKPVVLRDLGEWTAVRLAGSGPLERERIEAAAPEVPPSQVHAFEQAGWTFLPTAEADALDEDVPRARVFVKPGGRLALSPSILVVKFRDDVSEPQAEDALRSHGGRVIEKLGFAPGLFRVAVQDRSGRDAVDVANELAKEEGFEFAEPELIEMIGARSPESQ